MAVNSFYLFPTKLALTKNCYFNWRWTDNH